MFQRTSQSFMVFQNLSKKNLNKIFLTKFEITIPVIALRVHSKDCDLISISAFFHDLLKFEASEVRYTLVKLKGSGGDLVTSPPLNRKVGCSRPTMFRACCLRARQHYPAQQINLIKCMLFLRRG